MQGPYYCYFVLLLHFVAPLGTNTTSALLLISFAFSYPREKTSTMSIHSYFAVKQHDEPELEKGCYFWHGRGSENMETACATLNFEHPSSTSEFTLHSLPDGQVAPVAIYLAVNWSISFVLFVC